MKSLRLLLSGIAALLLTAGYLANEVAWFQGDAASYVAKVDQPPIRALAALIFVAAIVLAFIPDRKEAA